MYKHRIYQDASFAKTQRMKKVKLYIATSLDGYIARPDGSLDWLTEFPNPDKLDYGYPAFYESIDTVIMGRLTYEEILGFDVPWPYADCASYTVSSKPELNITTERTQQVEGDLKVSVEQLTKKEGKDIWIVGGGRLIAAFMQEQLIDELILTVIPVVLGEGIPLFPEGTRETYFDLAKAEGLSTGAVLLRYTRKAE